jgi:hypothetical protein
MMVLQADMASSRGEKMSAFFPREQNWACAFWQTRYGKQHDASGITSETSIA